MKLTRKLLVLLLIPVLLLPLFPPAHAWAQQPQELTAEPLAQKPEEADSITTHGANPQKHPSKEEIAAKWATVTTASSLYVQEPVVSAPYQPGRLSDDFLESGITYLNYIRFVAGLPEVQLDETLCEDAQYGAVLLAAVDYLSHTPGKPADMDSDFYKRGYDATSSSNISARWGYAPLGCIQGSLQGCLDDSGDNNLATVGHRRWLLNPTLGKVGFGYAQSAEAWSYIVTPVFDRSGAGCDFDFISWPINGNQPTNLFNTKNPWSVTLNSAVYKTPSAASVKITITRVSDGKQWNFDSATGQPSTHTNPYMIVNNQWYGLPNCIIFHPGSANVDSYMGLYRVNISGIQYTDGSAAEIEYEVDFFDPDELGCTHSYENGFCTDCDVYEPAVLKGDVYEISNAGQLYWFAEKVNNGEYTINGKLMADIVVNENVLKADGTLGSGKFRAWTPIGAKIQYSYQGRYDGTFDGNYKTISGLYFSNSSTNSVALFGCLGQFGEVKNLGILDSYFRGHDNVGAIAGVNYGIVDSCYSNATVKGDDCVGGIAGSVDGDFNNEYGYMYGGTVKHCYSLSYVNGYSYVGGVAGYVMNMDSHLAGKGKVSDSFFLAGRSVSSELDGKAVTEEEFASGEVAYYLGDAFGQTIGTDPMPVFGGAKVYRNQTGGCSESTFTYVYSNTASEAVTTHELVDATCEKAAYCLRCGLTQGKPLGHNYETKVVEPTCTEGGYSETRCTRCGDGYVSDEVGALGHDHVGTVTEPTCQEGGCTTYVCSRCGDRYVGDYTDPVDHVYEDGHCKWCDDAKKDYSYSWYSGTTSLNGTIDLNIYAVVGADLLNDPNAFVRFSYRDKIVDVPMSEALHAPTAQHPNLYRFSCPMYAKEVVEDVTVRMMLGDEVLGDTLNYGITTYCLNRIQKSTNPAQVALCKALLNYAAAAQVSLNYKTDTLANAGLSEEDKVLPEGFDVSAFKRSVSGSEIGIKADSATLMMESEVSVRVYFTLEAGYDIDDFTFTIDGQVVTPACNEYGWYVETESIAAKHLDNMYTVRVGGITVKYGPMSYVYSKLSATNPASVNLAKALYGYWQAAEELLG